MVELRENTSRPAETNLKGPQRLRSVLSITEGQIPGDSISIKIPQRQIRILQKVFISQARAPILVELIANPNARAIVGELFPEGPAEFLGKVDGQIRFHVHVPEHRRGNRVTDLGYPQVVGVVAQQMFPPGRQRMVVQPRLLPDPRIDIVLLKIATFGRSVKAGSIETSSCPQTDFLFRVELEEGPAAPAPTVMEDGFLIIIVQAALRFQAD